MGIFLKISGLMENPDPGNDINEATVPNTLGIMTLTVNNNSTHWGGKKIRRILGCEIRKPNLRKTKISVQAASLGL